MKCMALPSTSSSRVQATTWHTKSTTPVVESRLFRIANIPAEISGCSQHHQKRGSQMLPTDCQQPRKKLETMIEAGLLTSTGSKTRDSIVAVKESGHDRRGAVDKRAK
ncbi:uncharacterized protein PHALS_02490 [Plasmopara halstedii]|uniref:Uncharacterized protein n=1 Tax=Plasmopara halstedii TaxID=4781 RepID=A0A0P1A6Y7_PLAHL|nr:uncharacterized protein PHALS_02490 [Plasmopara halstedii]CEG36390.1 hypothetical protein PHALS_02490 [Plasmopara halstedii]|eukprot:XP_024572759.1 hypothetical protein PHALS_02490 [Plasmopara halstedii]